MSDNAESDVVYMIKSFVCMNLFGNPGRPPLPQQIIQANTPLSLFPEPRPSREIVINKMDIGYRFFSKRIFDNMAIIGASEHKYVMSQPGKL
jgi:hypothetical protein